MKTYIFYGKLINRYYRPSFISRDFFAVQSHDMVAGWKAMFEKSLDTPINKGDKIIVDNKEYKIEKLTYNLDNGFIYCYTDEVVSVTEEISEEDAYKLGEEEIRKNKRGWFK